jgi:hypothetical protein
VREGQVPSPNLHELVVHAQHVQREHRIVPARGNHVQGRRRRAHDAIQLG